MKTNATKKRIRRHFNRIITTLQQGRQTRDELIGNLINLAGQ